MTERAPNINTPVGRVSFPHLDKMHQQPGASKSYFEVSLLFDPETQKSPEFQQMKAAIDAEIKKAYPSGVPEGFLYPIQKAEVKRNGQPRACYAGTFDGYYVMQFKSTKPVGCVGPKKDPATQRLQKLDPTDQDVIYPGCYGRVSFHPYVYKPRPGIPTTGVFLTLHNFQKTGDGDRLGGASADSDFGEVESEAWTGTQEPGMEFLNG